MKRREFLQKTGRVGLGLGVLASLGNALGDDEQSLTQEQNRPSMLIPENLDAVARLPLDIVRKVLIIGGGIAGLSAAMELAERGYQVTLQEASSLLGGRLRTRTSQIGNERMAIEHGLHMWFYHYFVFEDILTRLGTWEKHFRPFEEVYFKFRHYKPELMKSVGPYPLNLMRIVLTSPNLNLLEAAQMVPGIKDVVFFNYNDVWRFDKLTLSQWAAKYRVNKDFFNVVIEPAASVTLNSVKRISAAQMLLYMHYYFIGHPNAFHRRIPTTDHATAVLDPWRLFLERRQVQIKLGQPVLGLKFLQDRVIGHIESEESFDQVVLATDIPGLKSILEGSVALDMKGAQNLEAVRSKLRGLDIAPYYAVLRVACDKPLLANAPFFQSVIETPEHRPINLVAVYSKLEEPSIKWAEKYGGAILEFHLYDTPEFRGAPVDKIWQEIAPVAEEIIPALKRATILYASLGSYENFTSYEAGQASIRPKVNSPLQWGITNLSLAGDWVMSTLPSALMENSVVTGREVAN